MLNKLPRWIVVGSFVLASVAGMVNTTAILMVPRTPVSHMTGNFELLVAGITGADVNVLLALSVLGAFVTGAVVSGMVVGNERLVFGRRYGVAMLIQSGFLLMSWLWYRDGSPWGIMGAAAACGLQNAMVSTYSGAAIRTTHLTGVISDLGSMLGNLLTGQPVVRRHLVLLLEILGGFMAGGLVAGFLVPHWGAEVLLIPASLSFTAGGTYLAWRMYQHYRPG